jgi:SnoaL-like domain
MLDKIDRLLAIEEIKQLKGRYFRFLDTKDWPGMRTIWTDDAVFDARAALGMGAGQQTAPTASDGWVYSGRDAIVAFISGAATAPTAHHGHCHEIEIMSATDARGIIAMEDYSWPALGDTRRFALHGFGHYHEEYRCVDGQWRIHRSRLSRLNVMVVND